MNDDLLYAPIGNDQPVKSKGVINEAIEEHVKHNMMILGDKIIINYTDLAGNVCFYEFTLTDIERP
jgi:hypothetical protein